MSELRSLKPFQTNLSPTHNPSQDLGKDPDWQPDQDNHLRVLLKDKDIRSSMFAKCLSKTIRISSEFVHVPNMLPNALQKSTVLLLFDLTVVLWALKSTNKIRIVFECHEVNE